MAKFIFLLDQPLFDRLSWSYIVSISISYTAGEHHCISDIYPTPGLLQQVGKVQQCLAIIWAGAQTSWHSYTPVYDCSKKPSGLLLQLYTGV